MASLDKEIVQFVDSVDGLSKYDSIVIIGQTYEEQHYPEYIHSSLVLIKQLGLVSDTVLTKKRGKALKNVTSIFSKNFTP